MSKSSTRGRLGLAVALTTITTGLALAAPAFAARAQSASGHFSSGPFTVTFVASRAAGAAEDQATGTFSATMGIGSATLGTVAGPVTCLDVVGNRVGLFYPITSSNPAVLSQLGAGIYLYAQLGADGMAQSVTFLPSPASSASTCTPLPGLLPISSGSLSLSS